MALPTSIPLKFAGFGGLIMVSLLAATLWRIDNLSGKLDLEQTAHKATKAELIREVEKGLGWKIAYEEALHAAEAHSIATQACLDRAAKIEAARIEREAILQTAQIRPQTQTDKQQVVNDATRKRAANHLNRSF